MRGIDLSVGAPSACAGFPQRGCAEGESCPWISLAVTAPSTALPWRGEPEWARESREDRCSLAYLTDRWRIDGGGGASVVGPASAVVVACAGRVDRILVPARWNGEGLQPGTHSLIRAGCQGSCSGPAAEHVLKRRETPTHERPPHRILSRAHGRHPFRVEPAGSVSPDSRRAPVDVRACRGDVGSASASLECPRATRVLKARGFASAAPSRRAAEPW
jgi:hypothetical protein